MLSFAVRRSCHDPLELLIMPKSTLTYWGEGGGVGLGRFLIYSISRLNGGIEVASEAHERANVKPCLSMKGVQCAQMDP